MQELAPLIYDLAIMLGVAAVVILIFQRIRQPVVLGYLVAGVIIGPNTPPRAFVTDIPNIQTLSELGVIFLMFFLGLEFSFHKLMRVGFSASITGIIEVVVMILVGFAAGQLLGWTYYDSLFLGAALSISSTTIIIKAIEELGLKTKRFAEVIVGVLVVEDLLAILLLVALSTVVFTKNLFSMNMFFVALKLIVVVGGWFLVGYFIVPTLFRRMAKYISEEILTIISVALCLFLVVVATYFNYSAALGAFIMGSILAETSLVHRIINLIRPIRDIFAAVFFISVGMLIKPMVIFEEWLLVILISLVTIFGKLMTTSIGTLLTGQSVQTSVRVGFSMAQVGEFSFIIAALGLSLNVTSDKLYPIIVAVSAITTFTTPYLIRLSGYVSKQLEEHLPSRTKYFLANYSAWVWRSQTARQQNSLLSSVTIRLFLNGIIVATIFTLAHTFIFPEISHIVHTPALAKIISLMIAMTLASPFIWGMLFSHQHVAFPKYSVTYLNPAVSMVWFVTIMEVVFLSIIYFHTWLITGLLIVIAIFFFIMSYRHLEKSYHWFERQLMNNISSHNNAGKQIRYEELAPWDTHLVEVDVGHYSAFANKTLSDYQIRQQYGINIVAIYRHGDVIIAPRGNEKILPHDKLIILGNDEQIDAFKKQIEVADQELQVEPFMFLQNFTLKTLLLDKDHPLIGKSIRDSRLRELVNGLVVGIERNNMRILNPEPEMILEVDDLVFVVGEIRRISHFHDVPHGE